MPVALRPGMDNPGYIALSRLASQARATALVAHNLANADTPGFKANRPIFAAYLNQNREARVTAGDRDTAFTWDRATWRDTQQGPIRSTGNPLDLALAQDGFFAVETPRGERFTRAGGFSLAADGRIVDAQGHALLGENGQPLQIAAGDTDIKVAGDGSIATSSGAIGRIRVVRFENMQALQAEGDRLFGAGGAQPEPVDKPGLVQGALESSNVSAVEEMTRLTLEMREFQFAAQFAEKEGERLQGAVDRILRRNR
jgi:flagellar basal-body rod protein FlgF